jgi:hypothetical protein
MKRMMIASLAALSMITVPAFAATTTAPAVKVAKQDQKAQAKSAKASQKAAAKSTKLAAKTAKKAN